MSTVDITLSIPEETLVALRETPEHLGEQLRLAAAIRLLEVGRLSSGAAARPAGIPRPLFLMKLGEYGVPTFHMTEEELRRDVENA